MLFVGRSYFAGGIHAAGQARLTCRSKHEGNTHTSHPMGLPPLPCSPHSDGFAE